MPIDNAPAEERRGLSQEFYVERWVHSAANLEAQGCYAWLADQLRAYSPSVILDVGCGVGTGVIALCSLAPKPSRIVTFDDNIKCLEYSRDRFEAGELDVRLVRRFKQARVAGEAHWLETQSGSLPKAVENRIIMIEADILWDEEFVSYAVNLPKFDAVTVWLIGTFDRKVHCRNMRAVSTPGDYRLMVQNAVYSLADKVLRQGGVLQVADRMEVPATAELERENIASHSKQAEGTMMRVIGHAFMAYEEGPNHCGMPMRLTIGTSGRRPDKIQTAIVSIISVKE